MIEAAPPDWGKTSVMAQVKVIHDVMACIYKINRDKPVSKWFFQTKLEEQQKDKLVERLKVSSGLVERTKELGIFDFKIKSLKMTWMLPPKSLVYKSDFGGNIC